MDCVILLVTILLAVGVSADGPGMVPKSTLGHTTIKDFILVQGYADSVHDVYGNNSCILKFNEKCRPIKKGACSDVIGHCIKPDQNEDIATTEADDVMEEGCFEIGTESLCCVEVCNTKCDISDYEGHVLERGDCYDVELMDCETTNVLGTDYTGPRIKPELLLIPCEDSIRVENITSECALAVLEYEGKTLKTNESVNIEYASGGVIDISMEGYSIHELVSRNYTTGIRTTALERAVDKGKPSELDCWPTSPTSIECTTEPNHNIWCEYERLDADGWTVHSYPIGVTEFPSCIQLYCCDTNTEVYGDTCGIVELNPIPLTPVEQLFDFNSLIEIVSSEPTGNCSIDMTISYSYIENGVLFEGVGDVQERGIFISPDAHDIETCILEKTTGKENCFSLRTTAPTQEPDATNMPTTDSSGTIVLSDCSSEVGIGKKRQTSNFELNVNVDECRLDLCWDDNERTVTLTTDDTYVMFKQRGISLDFCGHVSYCVDDKCGDAYTIVDCDWDYAYTNVGSNYTVNDRLCISQIGDWSVNGFLKDEEFSFNYFNRLEYTVHSNEFIIDDNLVTRTKSYEACYIDIPSQGSVSFDGKRMSKPCEYINSLVICDNSYYFIDCKFNDVGLFHSIYGVGSSTCNTDGSNLCMRQTPEVTKHMEGLKIEVKGLKYEMYDLTGPGAIKTNDPCIYEFRNQPTGDYISYIMSQGKEMLVSNHVLTCIASSINPKIGLILAMFSIITGVNGRCIDGETHCENGKDIVDLSNTYAIYSEWNEHENICYKKSHDCIFYKEVCLGEFAYFKKIDGNEVVFSNYFDSCFDMLIDYAEDVTTESSNSGQKPGSNLVTAILCFIIIHKFNKKLSVLMFIILTVQNIYACEEWEKLAFSMSQSVCVGEPMHGTFDTHLEPGDIIGKSSCTYFSNIEGYEIRSKNMTVKALLMRYYDNYMLCSDLPEFDLDFNCGDYTCVVYVSTWKLELPTRGKLSSVKKHKLRALTTQHSRARKYFVENFPEYNYEDHRCDDDNHCYEDSSLKIIYRNNIKSEGKMFIQDEGYCSYFEKEFKFLDNYERFEADDDSFGYLNAKQIIDSDGVSTYSIGYSNKDESSIRMSYVFNCISEVIVDRAYNKLIVNLDNIEYKDTCTADIEVTTYGYLGNRVKCTRVAFGTLSCKFERNMCKKLIFADILGNYISPYGRHRIQAEANKAFNNYINSGVSGLNFKSAGYMYEVSYASNSEYQKDIIGFTGYCTAILFLFLLVPWVNKVYIAIKYSIICRFVRVSDNGVYPRMYPKVVNEKMQMADGCLVLAARKFAGLEVDSLVVYRGMPNSWGHKLCIGLIQTMNFFKVICFPLYVVAVVPMFLNYLVSVNFENMANAGGIRLNMMYQKCVENMSRKKDSKYAWFKDHYSYNSDGSFRSELEEYVQSFFRLITKINGMRNVLDKSGDKSIDKDVNRLFEENKRNAEQIVGQSSVKRVNGRVKRVMLKGNTVPIWLFVWVGSSILTRGVISWCHHPMDGDYPISTWPSTDISKLAKSDKSSSQSSFLTDYVKECSVISGDVKCEVSTKFTFNMPTYEGAVQQIVLTGEGETVTGFVSISESYVDYETLYEYHTYPFNTKIGEYFNNKHHISEGDDGRIKCIGRNPLSEQHQTWEDLTPSGSNDMSVCTTCCEGPHPSSNKGGCARSKCVLPVKSSPITVHQIMNHERKIQLCMNFPSLNIDKCMESDGNVEQICVDDQCMRILDNKFKRDLRGERVAFFLHSNDDNPIEEVILGLPGPGTTSDDGLRFGMYGFPSNGVMEYSDRFINNFDFYINNDGCHFRGDNVINVTYDNWSRYYNDYETYRGCSGQGILNKFLIREENKAICIKECNRWIQDVWNCDEENAEEKIITDMMMPSITLRESNCGSESILIQLDLRGELTTDVDEIKVNIDSVSCMVTGYMADVAGIDINFYSDQNLIGTLPEVHPDSPILITGVKIVFPDVTKTKGYSQGGLTRYIIQFKSEGYIECGGQLENPDDIVTGSGSQDNGWNSGNSYSIFDDLWGIFALAGSIGFAILLIVLICSCTGNSTSTVIRTEEPSVTETVKMNNRTIDETGYNEPVYEDIDINGIDDDDDKKLV